jgi:response regulator of citrate/malate metabolism
MTRLHNTNLQSEIDAYITSQETDTNLTSLQANLTGSNDNLTGLKAHDLTGVKEAILAFCAEWHSVTEIAQHVHRSKQYVRGEVLPLIKDQLEMLYPDNTSHPKQKYRVKKK